MRSLSVRFSPTMKRSGQWSKAAAFTGIAALITASTFAQTIDPAHLAGLKWRNIGPFRGGRVSAVAGVSSEPDTFYAGMPQGGIWKSTSAGQTWYPIFDAVKDVSSVGSIQVAPSDPNIIYAGTGEISGFGQGNGIYKSTDAGKTWTHIGLENSSLVPSLFVDPTNPDVVIAASLQDTHENSNQRGIFRSTDGGKTWKQTLTCDSATGVQHLTCALDNPKVMIATTWRRDYMAAPNSTPAKKPEESGLYKSTDGGLTWKRLPGTGLPKIDGRMCVAIAQNTNSQRVFLIGTFGFFRSDDGGNNWHQMAADDRRIANGQGWYTSGVYVDSENPDVVYTLATCVYRSLDGGKTFEGFKGAPGGDDPQQLWIDPKNHSHVFLGGDQGATISLDAGKTWGSWYNQPTGQFYHVSTDNQFPYWVYGTQQDSGCIATSSRGNLGAITPFDWSTHPGNEGGYIVPDPLNPKISYAVGPVGGIIRVTNPSGQWVQVEPGIVGESDLGGANQMTFSPTNPHELFVSTQKFLVSTVDGGGHWKKLSPDLISDPNAKTDEEKQRQQYSSISSFSPSRLKDGTIWVGTFSGFLGVTKNHGITWESLSVTGSASRKPRNVSYVEASATDPEGAYVLTAGLNSKDTKSHMFRTHDGGRTWQEIGLSLSQEPKIPRISLIRSDFKKPGLLYGLTHQGVVVSFDDGHDWQSLSLNLPTTEMSDLQIHGNDLVLATYGRGFWILDDVSPLRQITAATVAKASHLYKPADAYRLLRNVNGDTPMPPEVPHAANPPLGAIIYYSLAIKPKGDVQIEIVDQKGKVVRHFSSAPITPYDDPAPLVPPFWIEIRKPLPTEVGLNRINWNVRYDNPIAFNHDVSDVMGAMAGDTPASIEGPRALPGTYTVRLIVDGKVSTQTLFIRNDPRSTSTKREIAENSALRMNLYNAALEAAAGYTKVQAVKAALKEVLTAKTPPEIAKAAKDLDAKLDTIGGVATHERRFYGPPPATSFVNINGYLLTRLDNFDYGDIIPTEAMLAAYGSDWSKLRAISDQWRSLQKKEIPSLNNLLTKAGFKPLFAPGPALIDPPAPARKYIPAPAPASKTPATVVATPVG